MVEQYYCEWFIPSSVDGHTGSVHFLAFIGSIIVSILVCVLATMFASLLDISTRELLGQGVSYFSRYCQTVFQIGVSVYPPISIMW